MILPIGVTSATEWYSLAIVLVGMLLLLMGRFAEGWHEYEWRWKTKYLVGDFRKFPVPQWNGEPIGDPLLHASFAACELCVLCHCFSSPFVGGLSPRRPTGEELASLRRIAWVHRSVGALSAAAYDRPTSSRTATTNIFRNGIS